MSNQPINLLGNVIARYGQQVVQLFAALAGATGLFYAIGFIVVNIRLAQLGVFETNLIGVGFIVPGLGFVVIFLIATVLGVGTFAVWRRIFLLIFRYRARIRQLLTLLFGVLTLANMSILLGWIMWFTKAISDAVAIWGFVVGLGVAIIWHIDFLPLMQRLVLLGQDDVVQLPPPQSGVAGRPVSKARAQIVQIPKPLRSAVDVSLVVVLIVAGVFTYGTSVYSQIPPAFGGGLPIVVRFFGENVSELTQVGIDLEPGEMRETERVRLIAQTEDRYIVLLGNGRAVSFDQSFVQGIRYEPPEFFLDEAFFLSDHTQQGEQFLTEGMYDEALSEFNLVLDRDKDYVDALQGRIEVWLSGENEKRDPEMARNDYITLDNEVFRRDSQNAEDFYGLAVIGVRLDGEISNKIVNALDRTKQISQRVLERARGDKVFEPLRGSDEFDTIVYGPIPEAMRWFKSNADSFVNDGNLDEAIVDYTRSISYATQYAASGDAVSALEVSNLYVNLSDVYLQRDSRPEQALIELNNAVNVPRLNAGRVSDLHIRLSDLYLQFDPSSEEALVELDIAASVAGLQANDAADLFVRLKDLYLDRDQSDDAAAALEKAVNVTGLESARLIGLYVDLKDLYLRSGSIDDAASALERGLGVEGLRSAQVSGLYAELVRLYLDNDRPDDAARTLETAASVDRLNPADAADLYFQLSNLYRQNDRPGDAAQALEKAANLKGLTPTDTLIVQGRIALEAQFYVLARDTFSTALRLSPDRASVQYDLARALAALADEGTEAALRRALELDFSLADTARNTDDWDRYFAAAGTDVRNLLDAALNVRQARILRDQGMLDAAIEAYQSATALDPSVVAYWRELAEAFTRAARFADAIVPYQNALERLELPDPTLLTALGNAQFESGDFGGAIQSLTQLIILQGDETQVSAFVALARAYEGRGDFELAAETYEEAALLDPANLSYAYRGGINRLLAGQTELGQEALAPIVEQGGLRVEIPDGIALRDAPSVNGGVLNSLAFGKVLRIAADVPQVADGEVWWFIIDQVVDQEETAGWVSASSVVPSALALIAPETAP